MFIIFHTSFPTAQRAGLFLEWFGMVFFPSLVGFSGLGLFFDVRGSEAERGVVLVEPAETVFSGEKFFSRIGLEGGCVLRKKLAVGSVRSRKPPIIPSQTTHKTSAYPQANRCPAMQTTKPAQKQASTQFRDKAARYSASARFLVHAERVGCCIHYV
jgi:hypothetical protein